MPDTLEADVQFKPTALTKSDGSSEPPEQPTRTLDGVEEAPEQSAGEATTEGSYSDERIIAMDEENPNPWDDASQSAYNLRPRQFLGRPQYYGHFK